jgi:FkbM family methyltransferase
MKSSLSAAANPCYLFRPSQLARRLGRIVAPRRPAEFDEQKLPWGLPLRYRPAEHIGNFVHNHGVYDLPVSEAVYRLLTPGDAALDIGGNIGYVASIMAARVGPRGLVISFEPHPEVFKELEANVSLWSNAGLGDVVKPRQVALSNKEGTAHLDLGSQFSHNRGTAHLSDSDEATSESGLISVRTARLDDELVFANSPSIFSLAKIDVEGHELGVLEGATSALRSHRIRNILFEDYGTPPTPASQLLESCGYHLFRLHPNFWGVEVAPVTSSANGGELGPPCYIATIDPESLRRTFAKRGWRVLSRAKW